MKVLLVDDHKMFADSLERLLADEVDIDVVGTASDAAEATEKARAVEPDVVLLDYLLPDGEGPQTQMRIAEAAPAAKVVVMTGLNDEATLVAAIRAGCDGFVTKDRAADELVDAVRAVHAGEVAIPHDLLARALPRLRRLDDDPNQLTAREQEVLQLLADGLVTNEIASRLFISVNTVRNHVQNLMTKLDAHSRLEAVAIGVRRGLVARRPRT